MLTDTIVSLLQINIIVLYALSSYAIGCLLVLWDNAKPLIDFNHTFLQVVCTFKQPDAQELKPERN